MLKTKSDIEYFATNIKPDLENPKEGKSVVFNQYLCLLTIFFIPSWYFWVPPSFFLFPKFPLAIIPLG
jgi:hypothetical protein